MAIVGSKVNLNH